MKILLDSGLSVDTLDQQKKTALHHASESGKTRAARLLLKYGANPRLRDAESCKTPGELAVS